MLEKLQVLFHHWHAKRNIGDVSLKSGQISWESWMRPYGHVALIQVN